MFYKIFLLLFTFLIPMYPLYSQVKDAPEKRYVKSLPNIREADVIWAKRIWRLIDLRQPINKILKKEAIDSLSMDTITFPKLLINYFIRSDYIKKEYNIQIYNSSKLNENSIISSEDALSKLNANINTINKEFNPNNINRIYLMEDWFQLRGKSQLDFRILAIGFAYKHYFKASDSLVNINSEEKVLWFFYPNLRPLFKYAYLPYSNIYNESISIDDFFLKRKFESSIIKLENIYGKAIKQKFKGEDAVLESDIIKRQLIQMEQNLKRY